MFLLLRTVIFVKTFSMDDFYLKIYECYIFQNQHIELMPNCCCPCFDFLYERRERNAFRCSRAVAHNFSKRHVRYLTCHDRKYSRKVVTCVSHHRCHNCRLILFKNKNIKREKWKFWKYKNNFTYVTIQIFKKIRTTIFNIQNAMSRYYVIITYYILSGILKFFLFLSSVFSTEI